MKILLALILALTLAGIATAQPLPTKPVVPNVSGKFKAVAPLAVKAGSHIVIDATSAKGDVEFEFDPVAFPKDRATYSEKKKLLVLSTDTNGTYRITVYSWDDKAKERIEVKVTGGEGPDPMPDPMPIPTDPIEALKLEVRAGFAKIDTRLRLLEQIKPIPPPDPKPPPLPDPSVKLNEFGKLVLLQASKISRKQEAKDIALSYGETVSAIRAGGVQTPDAAVAMLLQRNSGLLKENAKHWAGFFSWLGNELTRRNELGTLTTMPQHAEHFEQIGTALLEAAK